MRSERRRKGRAVNGWLVLDKPAGVTSTYAVGAVRRAFDARKAGHAGTLDPFATKARFRVHLEPRIVATGGNSAARRAGT